MRRRTVGGDEFEAFTRWRRIVPWQRGEIRKLKRKSAKRERQDARQEIRDARPCEVSVLVCGHSRVSEPCRVEV